MPVQRSIQTSPSSSSSWPPRWHSTVLVTIFSGEKPAQPANPSVNAPFLSPLTTISLWCLSFLFSLLFLSLTKGHGFQLIKELRQSNHHTRWQWSFRRCRKSWEEQCTTWDSTVGHGSSAWLGRGLPPSCRRLRPPWVASQGSNKLLSSPWS